MRRWMGILLCVMPLTAVGATRLVTTAGANVGDCTVAPCATINYAVGQAVDGDTIDVGPGTFNNGGANVNITKSLIVAGEQAGVDARGRVATETLITVPVLLSEDNVVFDGFTVTCGACTGIGAGIVTSASFSGYQVLNNIVTGNPVGIFPGSTGATQAAIQFNHITDNNSAGGPARGINTDNSVTNLLIDQNWIDGHKGQNIVISGTDLNPAYAIITNNTFAQNVVDGGNGIVLFDNDGTRIDRNVMTGGAFAAIFIGGGDTNIQIHENSITGTASYAFVIGDSGPGDNGNIDIQFNTIMNNLVGVGVFNGNPVPIEMHFNRVVNNTTDMELVAGSTVDAENNWWGCNEGPDVCGTAVDAGATLDDDPWIVMDIAAAPASIPTLQTSTVTSDFLQNSDAVAISGTFDFTPTNVAFSATNGTMTPPADDLSGGAASSTFTPTSSGIATVSASLDDETVSTTITVSAITVTMILTSNNNPSTFGENVTFTATISNPAATGTVTFTDGVTPLGTVAVVAGIAQLTTNTLSLGSHTITATYSGDAIFSPATAVLPQIVDPGELTTVPTLSEWMLLLLVAMLAGVAMLVMKR